MTPSSAPLAALNVRHITYPAKFQPVEKTAALELARLTGGTAAPANRPGNVLRPAMYEIAYKKRKDSPKMK